MAFMHDNLIINMCSKGIFFQTLSAPCTIHKPSKQNPLEDIAFTSDLGKVADSQPAQDAHLRCNRG